MEKIAKNTCRLTFVKGKIEPTLIGETITAMSSETTAGAHSIFLGQVRKDEIDGKMVAAIEYTAYEELATIKMEQIHSSISEQNAIHQLQAFHSLGNVKTGEICLFVLVVSKHRKSAIAACSTAVEQIKAELPIWGKEFFADETYQWKENN